MPVPTFAVVHGDVRAHYFPSLSTFGASTKPTDTAVGQMITAEAASLAAAIAMEGGSASNISADVGGTYPVAYAWCQDTIRLGAAIRAMTAMAGAGAVPAAWKEDRAARYKALDERGLAALGDAPMPSQQPNGPRWHVGNHNLDVGDEEDISDAIPRFRRDDHL